MFSNTSNQINFFVSGLNSCCKSLPPDNVSINRSILIHLQRTLQNTAANGDITDFLPYNNFIDCKTYLVVDLFVISLLDSNM